MREVTGRCMECRERVVCERSARRWILGDHWDAHAERCAGVSAHPEDIQFPEPVETYEQRERRREVYGRRNQILRVMGFKNYADYLRSGLWAAIRRRVLSLDPKCSRCGKKATQVHHGRYGVVEMEGTSLHNLYPICGGCHRRIEFSRDGVKLAPEQATKRLTGKRQRQQRRGKPRKSNPSRLRRVFSRADDNAQEALESWRASVADKR